MRQFDRKMIAEFSIDHTMNFWRQMRQFKAGKNNSWAIRWYASIFLKNGVALHPSQSLVNNIGHDGSGIHSGINDIYNVAINPKPIENFPEMIEENGRAHQVIRQFLKNRKGNLINRALRFLKQRLG